VRWHHHRLPRRSWALDPNRVQVVVITGLGARGLVYHRWLGAQLAAAPLGRRMTHQTRGFQHDSVDPAWQHLPAHEGHSMAA
jgi:hypothetical protein